jgi:hypothetical protein
LKLFAYDAICSVAIPEGCPRLQCALRWPEMPLTIELKDSAEQTAFNLKRWAEVLIDPELARLPHRIETDRHGHIIMSPPPAPEHGDRESEIVFQLKTLLPLGRLQTPGQRPGRPKAISYQLF